MTSRSLDLTRSFVAFSRSIFFKCNFLDNNILGSHIEKDELFRKIFSIFDDKETKIRKTLVQQAIRELVGGYLIKSSQYSEFHLDCTFLPSENAYMIKHQAVCDAVLVSFGNECSEILLDMDICDLGFLLNYIRPSIKPPDANSSDLQTEDLGSDTDDINTSLDLQTEDLGSDTDDINTSLDLQTEDGGSDEGSSDDYDEYEDQQFSENAGRFLRGYAEQVGEYIRKCIIEKKYASFVKTFLGRLSKLSPPPYQITSFLNGLTRRGTCLMNLAINSDIIRDFALEYADISVICLLFRPDSSSVKHCKFYKLDDKSLQDKLFAIIDGNKKYKIIIEIGKFLYRMRVEQGNDGFVNKFLAKILSEYQNQDNLYKIRYLIDGMSSKGKQTDIVSHFKEFMQKYVLVYGSIKAIIGLWEVLNTETFQSSQPLSNPPLMVVLEDKFRNHMLFGTDVEHGVDYTLHTQECGACVYNLALKIQDNQCIDELILKLSDIYTTSLRGRYLWASPNNIHFLSYFYKGFTNFKMRKDEALKLCPLGMEKLTCHNKRYKGFLKTTSNQTLEDFINLNQHGIYHLCFNHVSRCCQCKNGKLPLRTPTSRVLHPDQLNLLLDKTGQQLPCHNISSKSQLCCCPAKSTVTTAHLDLTLLRCLLINFASICPQNSNIRLAVDDLIGYRNKLYGHAQEAKCSDSDYKLYKIQIEAVILTIAKSCNKENEMKQKLKDAEVRPLDETICQQYQNCLLYEIQRNEDIKTDIKEKKFAAMKDYNVNLVSFLNIAHSNAIIQGHLDDKTFVKTAALKEANAILKDQPLLILLAKGGSGKTQIACQLASIYRDEGYIPLFFPDKDVIKYRDLISLAEKHVIIVEDLFGRINVDYYEDDHRNILDILSNCLKKSSHLKMIFTIRNDPKCEENILANHNIFHKKYILNLDNDSRLSDKERISILLSHMKYNLIISCNSPVKVDLCFIFEAFPCCSSGCTADVKRLPCGKIRKTLVLQAIRKLEGGYLIKSSQYSEFNLDCSVLPRGNAYMIKHQAVHDAVLVSFGNERPDILLDMEICDLGFLLKYVRPSIKPPDANSSVIHVYPKLVLDKLFYFLEIDISLQHIKLENIVGISDPWHPTPIDEEDDEDDYQEQRKFVGRDLHKNSNDANIPYDEQAEENGSDKGTNDVNVLQDVQTRYTGSDDGASDDEYGEYEDQQFNEFVDRFVRGYSEQIGNIFENA
ncbi:unnamed protein product [Mytilus edulis]|uniref:Novel STAND NTPase 3 domain-containing protein n=1 Tax=Mytilus edulis TaxID=6550 RepID=A0A8S3RDQ2_MYTED|nr:unnamed protein product [Mytilus edulis]